MYLVFKTNNNDQSWLIKIDIWIGGIHDKNGNVGLLIKKPCNNDHFYLLLSLFFGFDDGA